MHFLAWSWKQLWQMCSGDVLRARLHGAVVMVVLCAHAVCQPELEQQKSTLLGSTAAPLSPWEDRQRVARAIAILQ